MANPTRRFDEMSLKVYQYFEAKYRENPSLWIKRDDAIIDLQDVIPPGVATRFSENYAPQYHQSLSLEQQLRRGRRQKLIAIMTTLMRNGHLDHEEVDNKLMLRLSMTKRDPAEFGHPTQPVHRESAPDRVKTSLEDLLAVPQVTPDTVSSLTLYQVAKSDIAHKWQVTHFISDGQPKIRAQYGNTVFEFTASAADALCDRITAQLIYARGELAQQNAQHGEH